MTNYVAVNLSSYSPWEEGSKSPLWWATVSLVAITSCVYAALIASYFYLRQGASQWPPGYVTIPSLLWPTVGTGIRLASEACTWVASRSARNDNRAGIIIGLAAADVLLIGWMVEVVEYYFHLPYDWTYSTYSSIEWTMQAWAFVAAASVVIWGLVELAWAIAGHFNSQRRTGIQILKLYWTGQTAGWVFFWLVIYFGARVFQK